MPTPNELPQIPPIPDMDAVFQQHYNQLTNTVNHLLGYRGPIQVANHLDMSGKRVMNVGPATDPTDAVSSAYAETKYSAKALVPQIESNGTVPLKGYKQLNSGTQREQVSSYMNDLISATENANNIDPIISGSGPFDITIPASKFQFADGSTRSFPSRTDSVTAPSSYTIAAWSISGGVATVILSVPAIPALTASTVVYISGTGGVIDGSQKISAVLSSTAFQFQTNATGSGSSGTVSTGGVIYYYITKKSPIILMQQVATSADTPYNRLPISSDQQQLIAVVSISSSGNVQTSTAGGGTPTNAANGGSFF
jgi:hypothetical protein